MALIINLKILKMNKIVIVLIVSLIAIFLV